MEHFSLPWRPLALPHRAARLARLTGIFYSALLKECLKRSGVATFTITLFPAVMLDRVEEEY